MWHSRGAVMEPVAWNVPVAGSYSSAEAERAERPTRPVAARRDQHSAVGEQGGGLVLPAMVIDPVGVNLPVAGS